jgi:hypothetical protein
MQDRCSVHIVILVQFMASLCSESITRKRLAPLGTQQVLREDGELCHAQAISYSAFLRRLNPNSGAGVILVMASCYYGSTGWTIFFKGNSLMQVPPPGIVEQHDTFFSASRTSLLELSEPPTVISITDAYGIHEISVGDWVDPRKPTIPTEGKP